MSYKCYKCGKTLDDKAPSCDRYDTNRIKVASNKNKNETKQKKLFNIYNLLTSFIFIGLVIYNFSNIELQHIFGGIAIVLNIFLYLIYKEIVKGWL